MMSVEKNKSLDEDIDDVDITDDIEDESVNKSSRSKPSTTSPDSDVESNPDPDSDVEDSDQNLDIDSDNSESDFDPDADEFNETTGSKQKSKEKGSTENENTNASLNDYLQPDISNYSDVESDVSSDDEDNYKKLDHSRSLLNDTHKSLQSINYIEVEQLSRVTRDEDNRIIDDNHRTVPILSKYERTRILGLRSRQINSGARPFINVEENIIDGYIIAERELIEKKIPFIIKRPISNDKFEYWRLEDLEIV